MEKILKVKQILSETKKTLSEIRSKDIEIFQYINGKIFTIDFLFSILSNSSNDILMIINEKIKILKQILLIDNKKPIRENLFNMGKLSMLESIKDIIKEQK